MKTDLARPELSAGRMRFAIVVARWNREYTSRLADGAAAALRSAGVTETDIGVFDVPGAFELPLVSKVAAESGDFDAVIALGVVIRGETPHFDYVAGQAAAGLMTAGLETGVPVMFGVITADTIEQVVARCGEGEDNKGYEAALSAVEMVHTLRNIKAARAAEKAFPHVV